VDGVDKLPTLTINQRHGSGLPIPVATIVSADCLSGLFQKFCYVFT